MASAPTPRYFDACSVPSINALRMVTTACSIEAEIALACSLGALERDLYQCSSPDLNLLTHLKSHFLDRFISWQMVAGFPPRV